MARYFKYKSTADLLTEATTLGQTIASQDDLAPLFTPLTVGGRTVGNRSACNRWKVVTARSRGVPMS